MATVRLLGGKPLMVGGKVALSDDCCCGAVTAEGACCIDSVCSITTHEECEDAGGFYQGDDTTCGEVDCTECQGAIVQVCLSASATIICDFLGTPLTMLSVSGAEKCHTFESDDPETSLLVHDLCQEFDCPTFAEGNGCSTPLTDRYGQASWTFQRNCDPLAVIASVELGCSECTEPPCDPNEDPPLGNNYFIIDTINSLDDYPSGLPPGETIITDHYEEDVTLFGLPCHSTIDLTLTINIPPA
jgi:hypothetical protein